MTRTEFRTKAERVYIMLDKKSEDFALAKVGLTADTLYNRCHAYKTGNPLLQLVAVAEIRKNQTLKKVEKMFHEALGNDFEHLCGEWYIIQDKETIKAIEENGFKFFGKLNYRIKKREMINSTIVNLW
ncbi:MAG: GIY-YIG nuclease family protein [Bacteroidales bacterium]|nr:GIY-YIG nuclease family protein [Bacteroidales bacterium]